jgi:hypothetical protein
MQGDATEKLNKDAVAILLKSWETLSSVAIESAWKFYEDGEGEEKDWSEQATDERKEDDAHEEEEEEEEETSENIGPDEFYDRRK